MIPVSEATSRAVHRAAVLLAVLAVLALGTGCSAAHNDKVSSRSASAGGAGSPTANADPATAPWSVAAVDPAGARFLWGIPVVKGGMEVFSGMVVDHGVLYGQWGGCSGGESGVAAIDARTGKI